MAEYQQGDRVEVVSDPLSDDFVGMRGIVNKTHYTGDYPLWVILDTGEGRGFAYHEVKLLSGDNETAALSEIESVIDDRVWDRITDEDVVNRVMRILIKHKRGVS